MISGNSAPEAAVGRVWAKAARHFAIRRLEEVRNGLTSVRGRVRSIHHGLGAGGRFGLVADDQDVLHRLLLFSRNTDTYPRRRLRSRACDKLGDCHETGSRYVFDSEGWSQPHAKESMMLSKREATEPRGYVS